MSGITFNEVQNHLPALGNHPRVALSSAATPLQEMPNLSARLGRDVQIKRDDLLPLAMGGNKVRQLEYYLGQAHKQGADTVLITGAVQSNFVRLCAATARKLGWHPVVQLEDRVPKDDYAYNNSGNVLLLKLLGAEIHRFPEGENEAAADANLDRLAAELRAKGAKPYVIHLGIDHPPIGALGYAVAAVETFLQAKASRGLPDCVVIPSGSGLTHAGFLVGARAIGWDVPVYGICVRRDAQAQATRILKRSREVADLLGGVEISENDIEVSDAVLAPGYGQMNDDVRDAIALAARSDAILLDPVYSGRTFAGLISHLNNGKIDRFDRVLFIHTGGTPAIFAYQSDLSA
jgi:D-cysteine desulfhydrase family pyridoxal phosphate-dependent enzyme